MLNEAQKEKVIQHICGLIRESIAENGYFENFFPEKKEEPSEDDNTEGKDNGKKTAVLKWLDSAQELHSVLARKLYPNLTDGGARSEFSKKWRGEDNEGKPYEFDDSEINDLYNMRDDFIKDAGLKK